MEIARLPVVAPGGVVTDDALLHAASTTAAPAAASLNGMMRDGMGTLREEDRGCMGACLVRVNRDAIGSSLNRSTDLSQKRALAFMTGT
jgi:hypothetical protein